MAQITDKKPATHPLSSTEICEQVRGHCTEIRKVLRDVYGLHGSKARGGEYAYPDQIRRAAYEAECGFNRVMMLEFAEVHVALGLGPVTISGPCEHTAAEGDSQVGMTDKEGTGG